MTGHRWGCFNIIYCCCTEIYIIEDKIIPLHSISIALPYTGNVIFKVTMGLFFNFVLTAIRRYKQSAQIDKNEC